MCLPPKSYTLAFCFLQVMSLSPAPLSLLIKAAPILTDDMYGDIQPAAWELLLSVDEHMAAAAGKLTIMLCISNLWVTPAFYKCQIIMFSQYVKNCVP